MFVISTKKRLFSVCLLKVRKKNHFDYFVYKEFLILALSDISLLL